MARKTFMQEVKDMSPEEQKALIEKLFQELNFAATHFDLYKSEASRQGSISGISQKIFKVARELYGLDEHGRETEGVKECRRRAYTYLPQYRKLSEKEKQERDIDGFINQESYNACKRHLATLRHLSMKEGNDMD